jgi:hypothetical protein
MALINCPDCNHMVSDNAASCPSCGRVMLAYNDLNFPGYHVAASRWSLPSWRQLFPPLLLVG